MQQRLVVWGDIGTDHKALITIELDEQNEKVLYHAFPSEIADKQLQDHLFTVWKNGGEQNYTEDVLSWQIDSNAENLLPPEIILHKPKILINAQRQWQKKVQLKQHFNLLQAKVDLLKIELDSLKSFDNKVWGNAKNLWNEILQSKKENNITWQDTDLLKASINEIFDGLKAFKRINKENNYEASTSLLKLYEKRIKDCNEQLVYPDEWNKIFSSLQNIQKEVNKEAIMFKHKRILFNKLNAVFKDLRNYRKADQIHHLDERVDGLKRVVRTIQQAIKKDEESYEHQVEKMKHYTRGKMTDEEITEQFKPLKGRIAEKFKKLKNIEKTIRKLENKTTTLKAAPDKKPQKKSTKKSKTKSNAKEHSQKSQPKAEVDQKIPKVETKEVMETSPDKTSETPDNLAKNKKEIEIKPPEA